MRLTYATDHQLSPAPASLVLADQGVTHGAGDSIRRAGSPSSGPREPARFVGPGWRCLSD